VNRIKAIDLCCGAGGWACAARTLPIDVVLAVDLWGVACVTCELNHPNATVWSLDVRDPIVQEKIVAFARENGVRLVLGGIPCEWLSVYRHLQKVGQAERDANRLTLDSCLGLVKQIEPQWWCIEDVKQIIGELPPFVPYEIFDAAHWSGQRRRRCFIGEYPKPQRDAIGGAKLLRDYIRSGPYRLGRRLMGRTPQRSRTFSKHTCLAAELDRKAPTVVSQCSRHDAELAIVDPSLPGGMRNPEWQELAVIQGFPTDYLFYGAPTDVMKQVGRAVPIPLAQAILRGIVEQFQAMEAKGNRAGQSRREVRR
jgi:DNA (cytosine-5)-methyltransferase 1